MARIDATAAKAAAALIAAQVTIILQDDTLTELAAENKNAHASLRTIQNMVTLNPATGVSVSNDAYIDAYYAGNAPTSGYESGRQSNGPRTAPAVVTATLETAAPTNIVITFDAPIYDSGAVSIAGAAAAGKSITGITYAGAVVTITVSAAFIAADVVTVSGTFYGAGVHTTLTDQAITNNIV